MDDDTDAYIDVDYWSACTAMYSTLESLESHKDEIPSHCLEQYITAVQIAVLEGALTKYKDLVDHGYDGKFSTYERYIKEQAPEQINNFMASDKVDQVS